MKLRLQQRSYLPLLLLFIYVGLSSPISCQSVVASENEIEIDGKKEITELKGQFLGSSYKAKLISIQVGDRVVLIPYDSETIGLDGVEDGANVVLRYQGVGDKRRTVSIAPELAKVPVGVTEIEPEKLMDIINNPPKEHGYLLIDCRPAAFYAESHLPSAVSIPWTESKKRKAALLPEDKETLLIFYCLGSTCLLGPNSAALAVESGYKNIKVLLTELYEWHEESGGQLFSSDSYIANGNIVLVDLRSLAEAEAGHIPGAVNVPFADLEEAEYDFPSKKSAPIVVYGNGNDVALSVDIIKDWGFHQVTVVEGGYAGWIRRANTVKSGAPQTFISWQRQLGEGEISIKEFKKIVAANPADAVIIDVRTNEEVNKGKLKNSIHIPLNELVVRLAEIPDDKEIILHCTTGARAKMGYSFVVQQRSKVRFLNAKVICKNDKCRIRF